MQGLIRHSLEVLNRVVTGAVLDSTLSYEKLNSSSNALYVFDPFPDGSHQWDPSEFQKKMKEKTTF